MESLNHEQASLKPPEPRSAAPKSPGHGATSHPECLPAHLALKATFVEKIAELVDHQRAVENHERQMAAEFLNSDPLNLGTDAPEVLDPRALPPKQERRKVRFRGKRNAIEDDIFTSFGKMHDKNDYEQVIINGVVRQRVNFKRNWQSDSDLQRWRQALNDNTRNTKLMWDVQHRWHPDFGADRAELVQKHNALFRQRNSVEIEHIHRSSKKSHSNAQKLRDLQHKLEPKRATTGKKRPMATGRTSEKDLLVDAMFGSDKKKKEEETVPWRARSKAEEEVLMFVRFVVTQFNALEEAFRHMDINASGRVTYSEFQELFIHRSDFKGDANFVWHKLDVDRNGVITFQEFMNLKPYLLQDMMRRQQESKNLGALILSPEDGPLSGYLVQPDARKKPGMAILQEGQYSGGSTASSKPPGTQSESGGDRSLETGTLTGVSSGTTPQDSRASSANIVARSSTAPAGGQSPRVSRTSTMMSTAEVDSLGSSRRRYSSHSGQLQDDALDRSIPSLCQVGLRGPSFLAKLERVPQERSPKVLLPRTMSLLIFRNADRAHAGEAVFVARQPLTLEHLLRIISQECLPVVSPAEQLLDTSLKPVKCLRQVVNGGTYLLKGKEVLDPPPQFFVHQPASATSLRHLKEVQHASLVEQKASMRATSSSPTMRPIASPSKASSPLAPLSRPTSSATMLTFPANSNSVEVLSRPSSGATMNRQLGEGWPLWDPASAASASIVDESVSSSRVGSPPQQLLKLQQPKIEGTSKAKWEVDPRLAMHMSYGGLGVVSKHHNYDHWSQVRKSRSPEFANRFPEGRGALPSSVPVEGWGFAGRAPEEPWEFRAPEETWGFSRRASEDDGALAGRCPEEGPEFESMRPEFEDTIELASGPPKTDGDLASRPPALEDTAGLSNYSVSLEKSLETGPIQD